MRDQRIGLALVVIAIILFAYSIDRMDYWDQADKTYEQECLPHNNPQPNAEICQELENEANSRLTYFSLILFSSIIISLIGLVYLLPQGDDYPKSPPGGSF